MKTDVKPKHTLISLSQVEHESWRQIKTYTYKSVLRSILELDAPIMYFFMENLVFVLIFYCVQCICLTEKYQKWEGFS